MLCGRSVYGPHVVTNRVLEMTPSMEVCPIGIRVAGLGQELRLLLSYALPNVALSALERGTTAVVVCTSLAAVCMSASTPLCDIP